VFHIYLPAIIHGVLVVVGSFLALADAHFSPCFAPTLPPKHKKMAKMAHHFWNTCWQFPMLVNLSKGKY
jgi:hypothetical protein